MMDSITIARIQPAPTKPPTADRPLTETEQKLVGVNAPTGRFDLQWFSYSNRQKTITFGGPRPANPGQIADLKTTLETWGGEALDRMSGKKGTQSIAVSDAGPLAKYDIDGDGKIGRGEAGAALFAMTSYNAGGSAYDSLQRSTGKVAEGNVSTAGKEGNVDLAKAMFGVLYPKPRG